MPSIGSAKFAIALSQRLLLGLVTVWLVATVTFALIVMAPGDPMVALLGDDGDVDVSAHAARSFGTDQSAIAQYLTWMGHLASFDLGISTSFRAQSAT